MKNYKKEAKLVFNSGVARALLKAGCTIIDVKPDKSNVETGKDKTVFVFKNDEIFQVEFEKINKALAEAKVAEESKAE